MKQSFELWSGGPVFTQAEHVRLSTDSVLLANFANIPSLRKGIDLGCASGAIGLILLANHEKLHMTGIEIVPEAVETARKNMEENGYSKRSCIVKGDLRNVKQLFTPGSFDLVTANPPYFSEGSGMTSPISGRDAARGELKCTLEDVCRAAALLCRTGGAFCVVYRPERLAELIRCVSACGFEPKRLRLVCEQADRAPNLVLLESRRGGRPGLKIEPLLVLKERDGSESEEYRRIYRR